MDLIVKNKLDVFFSRYHSRKYRQGEVLFRGDENPPGVFYSTQGTVRQYDITKHGNVIVMNVLYPPTIFPLSWIINDTPNSFFFEAMEPVELWMAPQKETVDFLRSQPDVLFELLCRIYRGTDGALQRATHLMAASAFNRVVLELIITARSLKGSSQNNEVTLHMTAGDLAERTGLTRETVSRELQKLKTDSLVKIHPGNVTISDITALESVHGLGI